MMPENVEPNPGKESVWDYPRPPRVETCSRKIEVYFRGIQIANTTRSLRVLETSHPPVYYIPREDIQMQYLAINERKSYCEWKGNATYFNLSVDGEAVQNAAWTYLKPTPPYEILAGMLAFYPQKMDRCLVDGEIVRPQPGMFYGGWITSDIVGPFKGEPGSELW